MLIRSSALRRGIHTGVSAIALALAGCGGGGDSAPTVVATPDTLSVAAGASASVLSNDTIGGQAATAGSSGNVTVALASGSLPAGVTLDNGVVAVAPGTAPGSVSFSYRICESGNSSNCSTAAVQLTVPAPALVASADTANLSAGGSADLLANDTVGGAPASATQVTASTVGTWPSGVSLSSAGVLSVTGSAAPGTNALSYRICLNVLPSHCADGQVQLTVTSGGMVTGRALDARTAQGVAGVTVRVGALSAVTDATGSFTLQGVPTAERVVVVFDAPAHSESARIATVRGGTATDVQVRLTPLGASTMVDIASGGVVTVSGSTAQVSLPANGVQRADGSVPAGAMRVQLTPIDPATDSATMPGDFTTMVGGTPTLIESFGAINVRLFDSADQPLNLRPGQSATIRIPLSTRSSNPPSTIPLFFFDNASGRWVQEGTATLVGTGSQRFYEGTVTHFSTWNADQVYNTVIVRGCLVDASGTRISDALVSSDGIDYSGTSSVRTDAQGEFALPIRRNSTAAIVGAANSMWTNTLRVGPYSSEATLPNCLSLSQAGAGITMKLTWGARPSDLDSHLIAPNGVHVYFSHKGSLSAAPFANLDVDDVTSYGPEVVTITRLMVGTYKYSVRNFTGHSGGPIASSGARVELNIPGRTLELFVPPVSGETSLTDWWHLFELDVDAQCRITVRRVGSFDSSGPSNPSTTATYCTP